MKKTATLLLSGCVVFNAGGVAVAADHAESPALYAGAHIGAPVFRD